LNQTWIQDRGSNLAYFITFAVRG